jgi:hypothetical protein
MKTIIVAASCIVALTGASYAQLVAWDFTGQSNQATQVSTFNDVDVLSATLSRGAGAPSSSGGNSFRTTGFGNNGIDLTNTDYFEFTLTSAIPSPVFSLDSFQMRFAGTATYSAAPGVEMAWAYSLDGGSSYTLMPSFTQINNGASTYDLTGIGALQGFTGNAISFRFYASGQTTTGGWGFNNLNTSPGQEYGLVLNGTVPEPSTYALLALSAGAIAFYRLRSKRRQS